VIIVMVMIPKAKSSPHYTFSTRIRLLYDLKFQVLPAGMDKFYSSVDDHFLHQKTSRELHQWLLTWKPGILSSVTKAKQLGINSSMEIRRFFSSSSPT
jgi:hypothetical protein